MAGQSGMKTSGITGRKGGGNVMKRGLLWSMILAILASPTWASRTLHPGVQVGFAWTNLNYDDPDPFGFWDAQWDNGFTVGAFVDIQIIGPLSVVPELQFVRYQNKVEVDTGPGTPRITGDFQIEQDYVSFPLLVKWKPVPLAAMDFFVAGGVELGFLTSAKVKMNLVTQPGNLTDNTKEDQRHAREFEHLVAYRSRCRYSCCGTHCRAPGPLPSRPDRHGRRRAVDHGLENTSRGVRDRVRLVNVGGAGARRDQKAVRASTGIAIALSAKQIPC